VLLDPELELFAVGPDGRVLVGSTGGDKEELIDATKNGPGLHGDIRDLRFIGKHLYAAGMGRQVYRREGRQKWVHRDTGVLQKPSTTEVKGFNSIDGISESDMYAVGFGGEIWRWNGKGWSQCDSPTNAILNSVRAVKDELIYVCGPSGLLLAGRRDEWKIVGHDSSDEEFWALEWFRNELYVAADESLFRLNADDTLELVDMGLGYGVTCGFLHASAGLLLSVGRKHVCWTKDGKQWFDITP
jgi:hypothetical protein